MKVVDMAGNEVGKIELSDKVFGAAVNEAVLHTAVRAYLMNQRQGTQSTLTRTEVSGGGRKPWKQKGTGHARQGSTRAPQWVHGGIALGPKPRCYRVNLNKNVKRVALFSALSSKVNDKELVVVDAIVAEEYKTRAMVAMLDAIGAEKKTLIVLPKVDEKVIN
jgi:large subunit ribosomal protein L4